MDPEVCIGGHKTASGWQKVKGKCLLGKENALCKHQSIASEKGNFYIAAGRDEHSFKGLTKAWHILCLAGADWDCGIYPLPNL